MRLNLLANRFAAAAFAVAVTVVASAAQAQSWGGLYNMERMLNEPHPFAGYTTPIPPTVAPPPAPATVSPRPMPAAKSYPARATQAAPAEAEPMAAPSKWSWTDIFSEIRVGALAHDTGPFSSKEEEGADINMELLFASPKILEFMWSPRPHLGGNYSTSGDTSQIYAGLTWEWEFWGGWFAGFSLGGMGHNGRLVGDKDGQSRKSLGCRFLFRESLAFGYRFKKHHAIMAHLEHSSNASLCEKNTRDGTAEGRHDVVLNEGLEAVGIRYGYMF
jgi:lipid A 3-O-deacylase